MRFGAIPTARNGNRRGSGAALLALLVAGVISTGCQQRSTSVPPVSPKTLLSDAGTALKAGDFQRAEELARRIPPDDSEGIKALQIAGEAATKADRYAAAVEHYLHLAKRQQQLQEPPLGLFFAAEVERDAGRLSEAERLYRQFLDYAPQHVLTHARLALLTSLTARRSESIPHYFFLLRTGKAELQELILFADLDRPIEQRPFLEECQRKSPEDPLVQLGLAAHTLWEGNSTAALPLLQDIVQRSPESISAQALLGEMLLNGSDAEFLEWHRRLPLVANNDPEILYLRGAWARKHNQLQMAARCFWEVSKLAPTHRKATFQLGQVLRALKHPASEAIETRSRQLVQLTQHIDAVMRSASKNAEAFRQTILLLEDMGRLWEAAAWGLLARSQFPGLAWPQELLTRLAPKLQPELPQVLDRENLALRIDLSKYPAFQISESSNTSLVASARPTTAATIRFKAVADAFDFVYDNGHDPATSGARLFEQTGGGVAVLDYDRDGWPDLFLPQGGKWKTGSSEPEPPGVLTDRLYRNVDGGIPLDVTFSAGLIDRGFGQGAAVGDYDNDGFADLYVANVGQNQLLRNNGDGTFTDTTEAAGLTMTDWTVSCAIVDLNADGHPDLYDVNYLTGPQVYERICQGKACSPSAFAGAPDRLLISRGDGSFKLALPPAEEVDGKGLGIVAFDLHERGRPSLLIANDQVPNFLLHNQPTNDRVNVRLDDEAFVSGVAFNQDGLAMASMGIAADDFDGDGRLDFYISTFKDEGSMLFLQDSPGLFVDRAVPAGLSAATWPFVGWGAQSLDADADGWPDIVGVNGHVDDYRDQGGEFAMRPQFFHNRGSGRFEELHGSQIGPYFDHKWSGRGLSRLDWNRDGRLDFAVSNMGDPASLVLNETTGGGRYLKVRMIARKGARDAIGSVVEVRAGNRRWRKQFVAGDGYMASNERELYFGLGMATVVDEVTVEWVSGVRTTATALPVDATLEVIESAEQGFVQTDSADAHVVDVTVRHPR